MASPLIGRLPVRKLAGGMMQGKCPWCSWVTAKVFWTALIETQMKEHLREEHLVGETPEAVAS